MSNIFLFLLFFSVSAFSQINSSLICEKYLEFDTNFKKAEKISDREFILNSKYEFLKALTPKIFNIYISGNLLPSEKKNLFQILDITCLSLADQDELNQQLHATFRNKTLDIIKTFGVKNKKFAQLIETNQGQFFKLLGHYNESAPNEKKGGFHRGNKSIFMNFILIPPNEWPIIFAHEHLHSLDSIMVKSIEDFANSELIKQLITRAKTQPDLDLWPEDEKKILHDWLVHGLNRGFLGEYRAWTLTLTLYTEALSKRKIKKIQWLEEILKNRMPNQKMAEFTLKYLSEKWTNPTEFPFDLLPIATMLKKIRQELFHNKTTPKLGNFFQIIQDENE